MADHYIVLWDWKEQPPWDEIRGAQARGLVHVTPVDDTGSDQYAVVLAAEPLTPEQAQHAFNAEFVDRDRCPGCGCEPGEGQTPGCSHPDGCGFWDALARRSNDAPPR